MEDEARSRSDLIRIFLDRKNTIAVVRVSGNPEKYGHIVYKDLKEAGYEVYPVNPYITDASGDKCYPDLRSLPVKPDVVSIVVPPKVTEEIVKTCSELGITKVWMQPGSESDEATRFCNDNGIQFLYGVCIMIEFRGAGNVQ